MYCKDIMLRSKASLIAIVLPSILLLSFYSVNKSKNIKRGTVLDVLERKGKYSIFVSMVKSNNLTSKLGYVPKHGLFTQYTVLAPNNSSFENIPDKTVESLKDGGKLSKKIVKSHFVSRLKPEPKKLSQLSGAKNGSGNELTVSWVHGNIILSGKYGSIDVLSDNGTEAINGIIYPAKGLLVNPDDVE